MCEGVGLLHILALRLWRLFIVVCFAEELHGTDLFVYNGGNKGSSGFPGKQGCLTCCIFACMKNGASADIEDIICVDIHGAFCIEC